MRAFLESSGELRVKEAVLCVFSALKDSKACSFPVEVRYGIMNHPWRLGFLIAGSAAAHGHDAGELDFTDFCIMIFWTLIAVMIVHASRVVMGHRRVKVTQQRDQATQTDDVDETTSRKRKIMMNLKTQSQTSYTATKDWKQPRFYVLPEYEQGAVQMLVHEAQWRR